MVEEPMEEDAKDGSKAVVQNEQVMHQRAWLAQMQKTRRELFGDKVFPDSSDLIRQLRDDRTRQMEEWIIRKPERNE